MSLPNLAPLDAPLSEEEKRARQRLHVRRTYYRKLNLLQELREKLQRLEGEYAGLLAAHQEQRAHHASHSAPYAALAAVRERLRRENEAMNHALGEYRAIERKLQSWLIKEEEGLVVPGRALSSTPQIPRQEIAVPRLRAPIDVGACHQLARSSFEEMQRFRQSPAFLSTGVSVFGWRDRRQRQGDRVKFSLKKDFQGASPWELSLRGWAFMASAERLPSLYSASLNVRVLWLQNVDDDNTVLYRLISSPDGLQHVKSLFLVSRFQIPTGVVILLRSLGRDHLEPYEDPPGVEEQWIDYYTWVTFEATGEHGQSCQLDFGGEVQSTSVVGTDTWMLEVLFIALRWEAKVIGPVFSLC